MKGNPIYGLMAASVDAFAGLCTLLDPTNVPPYMSPDCQDVQFFPGSVKTRQGLTALPALDSGSLGLNSINGLKMYVDPQTNRRVMVFTSDGSLWQYYASGLFEIIEPSSNYSTLLYNSTTSFGREYMVFSDGKFGRNVPQAWNGTDADQVTQDGPGEAPVAADDLTSYDILASPGGVFGGAFRASILAGTGLTQSGNLVTLTLSVDTVPTSTVVGDTIVVAASSSYDGNWTIAAIPNTTQIQYIMPTSGLSPAGGGYVDWQLIEVVTTIDNTFEIGQSVVLSGVSVTGAGIDYNGTYVMRGRVTNTTIILYLDGAYSAIPDASGDGTASLGGGSSAGTYQLTAMFYTRNGYITIPAPPNSFVSGGAHSFHVTNIPLPLGLDNVLGRILAFTSANGSSFYTLPRLKIDDNTTTQLTVDFTDEELLSGENIDDLFRLVQLHEPAGVLAYANRLFWWGERNALNNLLSLSFDGGWSGDRPLGWTVDPTNGPGGARVASPIWGAAYAIIGDGSSVFRGSIYQSAYQDYLGNPIIQANVDYSIRFRAKRYDNSLVQGSLHVALADGVNILDAAVTESEVNDTFQEFTRSVGSLPSPILSSLRLYTYGANTITASTGFIVDNIEIFPTLQPYLVTQVRASEVDAPDSYDGVNGFLSIAPENGQAVRSAFVIRDYLYFVKESSLYVTQSDQNGEPATWTVREVSPHVGTYSIRGVGFGDEWVAIADKDGLYYFDGGLIQDDQKLSQEIQPTWDRINWAYGHTIDVKVDMNRKQIYVAVPLDDAVIPNRILCLDFTEGFGNPLTGKGAGRKWCPWLISTNAMNIINTTTGQDELWIGNNDESGLVTFLDKDATSDNGTAIDSYYEPGFLQNVTRTEFGYLKANVSGEGCVNITIIKGNPETRKQLRGWSLFESPAFDQERKLQAITQRASIRFGTNYPGHWFSLQGMSFWGTAATWSPIRGINSR